MKITREIDYAFRICAYLAMHEGDIVGAPVIAYNQGISERFTLRILRKLNLAGITEAKRGVTGGYILKKPKESISLYDIMVAVDGPIIVNNCLDEDSEFVCSLHGKGEGLQQCKFHLKFESVKKELINTFNNAKLDQFI